MVLQLLLVPKQKIVGQTQIDGSYPLDIVNV
jgi:hypothetical protein